MEDGDANGITDSERTAVLALKKGDILGDIDLKRQIITPNNDGINDVIEVDFSLMRLSSSTALTAQIYDLSGRLIRQVRNESITAGRHTVAWTGIDDSGALVPPGIYLLRIDIDVDSNSSKSTTANHLVHVTY